MPLDILTDDHQGSGIINKLLPKLQSITGGEREGEEHRPALASGQALQDPSEDGGTTISWRSEIEERKSKT